MWDMTLVKITWSTAVKMPLTLTIKEGYIRAVQFHIPNFRLMHLPKTVRAIVSLYRIASLAPPFRWTGIPLSACVNRKKRKLAYKWYSEVCKEALYSNIYEPQTKWFGLGGGRILSGLSTFAPPEYFINQHTLHYNSPNYFVRCLELQLKQVKVKKIYIFILIGKQSAPWDILQPNLIQTETLTMNIRTLKGSGIS